MSFLTELFIFLVAALAVVPLLNRLGLSSVIGYLMAGVIIGPSGIGLIVETAEILHFAEIGVVLLLFIIGLELQPRRLWIMRKTVFGLGSAQVGVTTLCLFGFALLLDLAWEQALLLGFALALSSTAFVIQLLSEKRELNQPHGRAAFGVLLFQDVAVIPAIAVLALLGPGGDSNGISVTSVLAVAAGLVAARYLLKPLLRIIAATGIHELFIAMSLAIVTGSALAMYWAGLSMGLGAFIAGMLVADSEYRHQMETDVMPFKGLLLGLFFIAVGMSANLGLLIENPLLILGLTVGLVAVKALLIIPLALYSGLDRAASLRTALVLSQGGEFAFVLLTVAFSSGLIPQELMEKIVLIVTLSMASTPFLLGGLERVLNTDKDEREFDDMSHSDSEIIIAGFGRFGQIVGRVLATKGIHFTAMDANPGQIDFVRSFGDDVYYGDARRLDLLKTAGIERAKILVVALEDIESCVKVTETCHELYPDLKIFARARSRQHEIILRDVGATWVIRDTLLSSLALSQAVLEALGRSPERAQRAIDWFREHDKETLRRQRAVAHDAQAYRQTTIEAAEELKQLFQEDFHDLEAEKEAQSKQPS